MKLRVQYTAQLRMALGRSEEDVELPDGASLADLLSHLAAGRPESASHLVTNDGEPRPSLLVVINGSAAPISGAGRTELRSGDVVMLLPPVAGG